MMMMMIVNDDDDDGVDELERVVSRSQPQHYEGGTLIVCPLSLLYLVCLPFAFHSHIIIILIIIISSGKLKLSIT